VLVGVDRGRQAASDPVVDRAVAETALLAGAEFAQLRVSQLVTSRSRRV
jgi:hypothetical protein